MIHKTTIEYEVIKYLETHHLGAFGGQIEDFIRMVNGSKGDTTARRLRKMVEDGLILCEKKQIENRGPFVNFYKFPKREVSPQYKVELKLV